jgi:glycosyltransferase involved in cell wall biosynthesis
VLSLDTMLGPVKNLGNLKTARWDVDKIFTEFDSVALLTQDTVNLTEPLTGIEHVPCAFSSSKRIKSVLSKVTFLRWLYFFVYSFFWLLKNRREIKLLVSINVDSPAPFFSTLFGIPYIVQYHYNTAYQVSHINKRFFIGILLNGLERFTFRRASVVWITAPSLMAKVKVSGAKRIRIIPNWVDIEEISKIEVSKERTVESRILFVGRLHVVKQVDLLIRAFSVIHDKSPNTSLYILGDGELKQNLITLTKNLGLSNSVHFVGYVDQKTVLKMMKVSDVFVLPSKMEGNPRVLIEAMASKIPIVATNVEGIRDIIQHMKTGYLINDQQPEQLAYAIEYVLKNKQHSANMVKNAFAFAEQNFSKEVVLQNTREELKLLLFNHKGKKKPF